MKKINYKIIKDVQYNSKSDSLVIGLYSNNKFDFKDLDNMSNSIVSEMISSEELSSESGKVEIIYTPNKIFKNSKYSKIFVVGLGDIEKANNDSIRSAFANLGRISLAKNINDISFLMDSINNKTQNSDNFILSAFEGFLLGRYVFDKYKSGSKNENEITNILIISKIKEDQIRSIIEKAIITSRAEMKARNLVNEPANTLSPSELSQYAQKLSSKSIQCKILD